MRTSSDRCAGSGGKCPGVVNEVGVGQGRSLFDKKHYPAFVILLLALLAGNGRSQVAVSGVQDVVAGHRQEMRV